VKGKIIARFALTLFFLPVLFCSENSSARPGYRQVRSQPDQGAPTKIPERVLQVLVSDALDDCEEYQRDGAVAEFIKTISARSIDLNQDGEPEVLIYLKNRCYCDAAGNCAIMVYRKTEEGYELLFEGRSAQPLSTGESLTDGYRDLVAEERTPDRRAHLRVHKWDGKKYQLKECFLRVTVKDKRGRSNFKLVPEDCDLSANPKPAISEQKQAKPDQKPKPKPQRRPMSDVRRHLTSDARPLFCLRTSDVGRIDVGHISSILYGSQSGNGVELFAPFNPLFIESIGNISYRNPYAIMFWF